MNYIQSADGTLALRFEAREALVLSSMLEHCKENVSLLPDELELISAIRNAAATLNHE